MPRILSVVGAVALATVVAAPAAYADPATHNGSAFGVKVDVRANNIPLVNVAPLPAVKSSPGGDKSVIELDSREVVDESKGLVHARLINAASMVKDGVLTSRASVADLALQLKNSKLKGFVSLTAELVTAKCVYGPDGVTAESLLAGVDIQTLAGLKKELVASSTKESVGAKPNTEIKVPGLGKVVLNEQLETEAGLVVNAIHVYLTPKLKLLYGDIVVSQATCYKGAGNGPDPSASPTSPGEDPKPTASASNPGEPTDPNPSDSAGGGGGGGLPVTGFKLATFAGLGVALVAVGVGALWFTRRRRAATDEA